MVEGQAAFTLPEIQSNPTGWGPNSIPTKFKDMPYQPFSKSDRLGKISDWTGNTYQDRRYMNKYNSAIGAGGTQYSYYYEEDESSFQLVDTSRSLRPMYGRGRFFRGRGNFRGGFGGQGNQRWNQATNMKNSGQLQVLSKAQKNKERERNRQVRKWQQQQRGRQNYNRPAPIKQRECSITVKPDWIVLEEMEKAQLSKLSLPTVKEPEDLLCCGAMEFYDKGYDRVNVKNERPLKRIDRVFHTVTTTDDPVIRKFAKSHPDANVFATDAILATLMCCTRSVYSWDIVVQKIGGKVFLDKRDNTEFDLLTVSETAAEPPQDEGSSLNSPRNLALEATFVNHNFSQQVLKADGPKYKFPDDNPFAGAESDDEKTDDSAVASVGYRYRKWDLGNDVRLIARTEHDAVSGPNEKDVVFMNVKALNEWDSRCSGNVDWRQKLDVQRGAVLANELKHNACKLSKWTVQALLAGSDILKFGYITRFNMKDSSRHIVLGTQQFKPSEFASQINLSMDNGWGIVRCIIDQVMAQKDGKYLIVKDPNKPVLRLYDIPDTTFESDEDTDDEDEAEEDALETPLKA